MFRFGDRSERKLVGVHPHLVQVSRRALELSTVDFGITEGLRSVERQRLLMDTGRSKTMRSRHITGHAVDVVAYDGKYTYEPFELYTDIAEAYRKAAIEHGVEIGWGAAWLKSVNYYPSAKEALHDYVAKRRAQGRTPFLDGPHFQLSWNQYPQ